VQRGLHITRDTAQGAISEEDEGKMRRRKDKLAEGGRKECSDEPLHSG
jgi:hypothetical protein